MKTIKLCALGLLFFSSFNVLGEKECNIIKASDKSTYTIKSSIYSYPNNINICKCQAGYEFSPFISGEELSKNGKQENSFTVSLDLAGKEFQCVMSKDNKKTSTAEWVIPVSIFTAIVASLPPSYLMFKTKPRLPGLLPDDLPGLSGDAPNVIENDYQPIANIGSRVNRVNWRNVSTSSTEYENIPMNPIRENIPMNPIHEDALINANDALGNQIQDIDSEEHIYSEIDDNDNFRGSMPSRSPAPEEIYDEISNNANLNSRTQCNIQ
ncbi:hypothetical protein BSPLISOX_542 [uncultured Gammaproteobacteria bacterium]|nr:hypothetical protein [uncultured Gammaproteobacteria bacterium]VVH66821.1 hypothetical protein BSPLISOX_542 [uncultured Gammaproteobacteria bacterium]